MRPLLRSNTSSISSRERPALPPPPLVAGPRALRPDLAMPELTATSGGGGKAGRSREEIELVFDRNKGRIYSLYARALRDNAELQGKLVLEFTIAPNGEVTMCRVISSELKDADLERKIIALVRLFRFDPKDVDTITTTKPIDFFPA